ncbi:hypothetical protein [Neptunomonas sp.]|uniref:hypothetical protein n=1 Tax=Neptunomonas sp. TaxID=1971898 RepID=UPI003569BC6D
MSDLLKPILRGTLLAVVYVFGFFGIVATGGGGGGGGDDDGTTGISYSGNTDPAVISRSNAARLVGNVLVGQTIIGSSSGGAAKFEVPIDTTAQGIGLVQVPGRLAQMLRSSMQSSSIFLSRSYSVRARTDVDETIPCDNNNGSLHITGIIEDDGTGALTLEYLNCLEGNETLDGIVEAQINAFDNFSFIITDAIYRFSVLILTTPTFSVSLDGSIHSQLSFTGGQTEQLTTDRLVARNNATGEMLMIRNQVNVLEYDNLLFPTIYTETITGRIFDSTHGFVDVTTLVPLNFSFITQDFPDAGQILLIGSLNSGIQATVASDIYVSLQIDADGDTSFELSFSMNWIELEQGTNLADSDGDGMHDSWELVSGLDPSNPADADQDLDGDGFSSIEEYLTLTDPTDPSSIPAVSDLSITSAVSGDPLAGSSISYLLTVTNLGPLFADNINVVNTLPPEVSFVNASGSGWNCNHASGTVICVQDLSAGLASTITITASLPLSLGNISNIATVSSNVPDIRLGNNTITEVTEVVKRAPSLNLDLGAPGFDVELDVARQLLYVSVPTLNSVEVIDLNTFTVINSIFVGSSPQGISMSPDGTALYVALGLGSAVAAVDLNSLDVNEIVVADELNTFAANDVFAPTSNEVFVSGFIGTAFIVKIDLSSGNQVTRVADDRFIGLNPVFAARSNPQFLFVGENFGANSLYKLDLTQPSAPIVTENTAGTNNASIQFAISSDGSKVFLSNGQVMDAITLSEIGQIGSGVSTISSDGANVVVGETPNNIGFYDTSTFQTTGKIFTSCDMTDIERVVELQAATEWVLLGAKTICRVTDSGNTDPVPPVADLSISVETSGDPVLDARFDYFLHVKNLGPIAATNVVVTDTLPAEVSYVFARGSGWSCSHTGGVVTCNRNSLDFGDALIRITVSSPIGPGNILNSATVSSDTLDDFSGNNSDTLVTVVPAKLSSLNLDLGAAGHDMELDSARQQLYVSVPSLNSVAIVSLATFTVTNTIVVGPRPLGISMNPDGDKLYVALNQGGAVAALDLNSLLVTEIDISTELGTTSVFDVIAPTQNEVFASGNPGQFVSAYIVKIDTANSNQVTRVASDRIIQFNSSFAARTNPQFLYIGEGGSSDTVYKLDLSLPSAPLLLERSVPLGYGYRTFNLDGSRLINGGGQILRTDSLTLAGSLLANGEPTLSSDGVSLLLSAFTDAISIYNFSTFSFIDKLYTSCDYGGTSIVIELQENTEWILLSFTQGVCKVTNP